MGERYAKAMEATKAAKAAWQRDPTSEQAWINYVTAIDELKQAKQEVEKRMMERSGGVTR